VIELLGPCISNAPRALEGSPFMALPILQKYTRRRVSPGRSSLGAVRPLCSSQATKHVIYEAASCSSPSPMR